MPLNSLQAKFFQIAEWAHLRLFGHPMSDEMRKFLGNLNYSFFATIIVGVLIYSLNVLSGRWLSVENFGKYQLVLSLSFFLIIPMIMGISTSNIYAITKGIDSQKVVTSSSLLVFIFSIFSSILMMLFSREISELFGIQEFILIIALIYTLFLVIYTLSRSILQGFLNFKMMAIYETLYAMIAVIVFLILVHETHYNDFRLPLIALSVGYTLFGFLTFFYYRKHISISSYSFRTTKILLKNGLIIVIASVAGFLLGNIDKFIINRLINLESVALYSVYLYSAGIFLNFFLQTFITVFFPSMSKIDDVYKGIINKKINKLFIIFLPVIFGLSYLFIVVSIYLFGQKYEIDYIYVGFFSFYIVVQFFVSTKQWLLASFKKNGILYSTYSTILASLINIIVVYFLTKQYGLTGAIVGLIGSLVLFVFINRYFLVSLLRIHKKLTLK